MKKVILTVIIGILFIRMTTAIYAQTAINDNSTANSKIYELFPTQNIWNFIKLDTRTGQMWQVQFDVEGNNQFETALNLAALVEGQEQIRGRFTLYPTQNMWNFILLDQLAGTTWQVQWSLKPETRMLVQISSN